MNLFLDTEWANNESLELVSLGILSEDERHRFYAERNPLPDDASEFVQRTVYPLLERGDAAISDIEFTRSLRRFLDGIDDPVVLHDSRTDRKLLYQALGGFGRPGDYGLMPRLRTVQIQFDDIRPGIERYFCARPEANARRHHAMDDAEALRFAFREATQPM